MSFFDRFRSLLHMVPQGYFEMPGNEKGYGFCSDDICPCRDEKILYGEGYIYISEEIVRFRRDCPKYTEFKQMLNVKRAAQSVLSGIDDPFIMKRYTPILMCEKAARMRYLDLNAAAADTKYWWQTGFLPLRATPFQTSSASPVSMPSYAEAGKRVYNESQAGSPGKFNELSRAEIAERELKRMRNQD